MVRLKKIAAILLLSLLTATVFAESVVTQRVVRVKDLINGSTTLSLSGKLNDAAMAEISSGNGMAVYNSLDSYLVFPTLLSMSKGKFYSKTATQNVSISRQNGKFQWTEKDVTSRYAFAAGEERIKPEKATFKSSGVLSGTTLTDLDQKRLTIYDETAAEKGLSWVGSLHFSPAKKGGNYKFNYNENNFQAKVSINSKGKITASYKMPPRVAYPAILDSEYVFTNKYNYSLEIVGEGDVESEYVGPDQVEFRVVDNLDKFRFFLYDGVRISDVYLWLELDKDTEVQAVFGTFDASLKIVGSGSATYEYTGQNEIKVTANESGSTFRYFTVNGEKYSENPMTISLQEDTEIQAVFGKYAFRPEVIGDGSFDYEFVGPDRVKITAPEDSKFFRYFVVNYDRYTDRTILLDLWYDTRVKAVFGTYDLSVNIVGNGSVNVEFIDADTAEISVLEGEFPFRYYDVNGEKIANRSTMLVYLKEDTVVEAVFGTHAFTFDIVGGGSAEFEFKGPDEVEIRVSEDDARFRYFTINTMQFTNRSLTLYLKRDTRVQAVFGTYRFSVEIIGDGSLKYEFKKLDSVEVKVPEDAERFRYLDVNGQKYSARSMLVKIKEDTVVSAVFGKYAFETVSVGGGRVESDFTGPDDVTFSAVSEEDVFSYFEWNGCVTNLTPVSIQLTCDTVVTATFTAANYLVVDISGGTSAKKWPYIITTRRPNVTSDECRGKALWLRYVPPGSYMMGSPENETGRGNREDQHKVTISKGFYIGVFEVTQEQYKLITDTDHPSTEGLLPARKVNYEILRGKYAGAGWPEHDRVDSSSVIGVIRAKTGLRFDIPTEAQWEYACRASTTTAYNSGNNMYDKDFDLTEICNDISVGIQKVGIKKPNKWGLYDMHGNVWELCLDWYVDNLGFDPVTDPLGPETGTQRVLRGGCYRDFEEKCRSAYRSYSEPDHDSSQDWYQRFGFRFVINEK